SHAKRVQRRDDGQSYRIFGEPRRARVYEARCTSAIDGLNVLSMPTVRLKRKSPSRHISHLDSGPELGFTMVEATYDVTGIPIEARRPSLDVGFNPRTAVVFVGILAGSLFFIAYSIYRDISASGVHTTTWLPFVLLGVALFIALGFEFVNGF